MPKKFILKINNILDYPNKYINNRLRKIAGMKNG